MAYVGPEGQHYDHKGPDELPTDNDCSDRTWHPSLSQCRSDQSREDKSLGRGRRNCSTSQERGNYSGHLARKVGERVGLVEGAWVVAGVGRNKDRGWVGKPLRGKYTIRLGCVGDWGGEVTKVGGKMLKVSVCTWQLSSIGAMCSGSLTHIESSGEKCRDNFFIVCRTRVCNESYVKPRHTVPTGLARPIA